MKYFALPAAVLTAFTLGLAVLAGCDTGGITPSNATPQPTSTPTGSSSSQPGDPSPSPGSSASPGQTSDPSPSPDSNPSPSPGQTSNPNPSPSPSPTLSPTPAGESDRPVSMVITPEAALELWVPAQSGAPGDAANHPTSYAYSGWVVLQNGATASLTWSVVDKHDHDSERLSISDGLVTVKSYAGTGVYDAAIQGEYNTEVYGPYSTERVVRIHYQGDVAVTIE